MFVLKDGLTLKKKHYIYFCGFSVFMPCCISLNTFPQSSLGFSEVRRPTRDFEEVSLLFAVV